MASSSDNEPAVGAAKISSVEADEKDVPPVVDSKKRKCEFICPSGVLVYKKFEEDERNRLENELDSLHKQFPRYLEEFQKALASLGDGRVYVDETTEVFTNHKFMFLTGKMATGSAYPFFASKEQWEEDIVPELKKNGFRVISVDSTGFSTSPTNVTSRYSIQIDSATVKLVV